MIPQGANAWHNFSVSDEQDVNIDGRGYTLLRKKLTNDQALGKITRDLIDIMTQVKEERLNHKTFLRMRDEQREEPVRDIQVGARSRPQ